VADPLEAHGELDGALEFAAAQARQYLDGIERAPVLDTGVEPAIASWHDPMPEAGDGTMAALSELAERGRTAALRSSGPRFFHFVMGGGTPAALAADWLTSTYDQVAYAWVSSPMAAKLEQVALGWLRELFELPEEFGGVLTSGATMANFACLAAARNWWAERLGVDVEEHGLAGLAPAVILTSGYVHPTAVQAVGMLGFGRGSVRRLTRDAAGRLDLAARDRELAAAKARDVPAIVIANAGEVNTGDFDPIADVAELADRYGAWLHVDGAFGLFARLAPATRGLTDGIERADSVIADGHKWLNVPYDSGFAFVRDASLLAGPFAIGAAYLPKPGEHPMFGAMGPEASRRARGIAIWATLRAYGRDGYREMVERHLDLAQRLAERIDAAPDLERLAEVPLNIVCFRYRPKDAKADELDAINTRLGADLLADGRVYAGTTRYRGSVAFRPAIVNWRTTQADIDLLVSVVRELGARLGAAAAV
jgi:glutamate/tyrosine decarboxylase-like PLP-dependent enzyme